LAHILTPSKLREGVIEMAAARLEMRQVKKVFFLHLVEHRSQSVIGAALGLGKTTVGDYIRRLNQTDLKTWPEIEGLDDEELERRPGFTSAPVFAKNRIMPDWTYVHQEMSKRHVTLALLWTEYRETQGKAENFKEDVAHIFMTLRYRC
jgi:hypothetical protein